MSNEGQNNEGIIQGATNPDKQLPGLDFASYSSVSVTNYNNVLSENSSSSTSFKGDILNASIDSFSNQLKKTEELNNNPITKLTDDPNGDLSTNNSSNGLPNQYQVSDQTVNKDHVSNLQIDNLANQQLSQISQQNNEQSLVLLKDSNSEKDPFSSGVPSVDELFGTNSQQINELETQNQVDDSKKIIAESQASPLQSKELLPIDHQEQIISNSLSQEQELSQKQEISQEQEISQKQELSQEQELSQKQEISQKQIIKQDLDLKLAQGIDSQDLDQDNSKNTDHSLSQVQSSIPDPASNILQNQVQQNPQNIDLSIKEKDKINFSAYSKPPTNREEITSVFSDQKLDQNALSKFIFPNLNYVNELGVGESGVSNSDLQQIEINKNTSVGSSPHPIEEKTLQAEDNFHNK